MENSMPSTGQLKGLKGSPSTWLERFISLIPTGGTVLDYACGAARNDGYMASWGLKVTGVDKDERCKPYVLAYPNTTFIQADLENGEWPFTDESFDAVLVNFYLYRPVLPKLPGLLKPGGYLLYETFMLPYEGFDGNRAKSKAFALEPLELVDTFRKDLEILAYEETLCDKGDCFQRILARKPIDGKNVPVLLPQF